MRKLKNIMVIIAGIIAILISFILFLIIIGLLIPSIPMLGMASTTITSYLTIQLLIASVLIGILAFALYKWGKKKMAKIAMLFSLVAIFGYLTSIIQLKSFAKKSDVQVSVLKSTKLGIAYGGPDTTKSVLYATNDDHDLYMDISPPLDYETKIDLVPVVLIHGGGYVTGTRGMTPKWQQFYNDRGYVVFDVDYRLSTHSYHTWDKSVQDVISAIDWISQNAKKYHVDMNKLILSGNSAGGGLALLAAYGIGDGTFKTQAKTAIPKAVITLYPAQELATAYHTKSATQTTGQDYCHQYFGGSPEEVPEAYAFIYPGNYLNGIIPPTLIIAGGADILVPFQGQEKLSNDLKKVGAQYQLVNIPYGVHAFDMSANSLSTQIAFEITSKFLDKYFD